MSERTTENRIEENGAEESDDERRRISERAEQAQRMEAVGQLAFGVAHDFNNILSTIRGYAELIEESLSPDDPRFEDVREILKSTERAAALTRQLLAFSRRQVLEPRPLDLNAVVLDMERMLDRLIGEDIELVTSLDDFLGTVKADRSQIEQVVMNLVVNARDAMPGGGRLAIRTRDVTLGDDAKSMRLDLGAGRCAVLEVADTGIGMSRETALHIFEPFFTTKPKDKGTGLGLSTVYGIVKQSNGDITVESEEGKGTEIRIFLPVVGEAPGQAAPGGRPEPETRAGWETILLAEDEESVRFLAKRMLERAGYKVVQARNGREALAACEHRDTHIHLLLTDVVMPEMGGTELADRIRRRWPSVPTVFMSGYSDEATIDSAVRMHDAAFLQKPFSYRELTAIVRRMLDSRAPRGRSE